MSNKVYWVEFYETFSGEQIKFVSEKFFDQSFAQRLAAEFGGEVKSRELL